MRAVLSRAGGRLLGSEVDIRHVVSPSTARTATALLDGKVDVSWGGPMRVMIITTPTRAARWSASGRWWGATRFCWSGASATARSLARSRRLARRAGRRRADAVDDLPGRPAARGPRPGGDRRPPRAAHGAQPGSLPPRSGGRGAGFRAIRRSPGERGRGHVWHRFSERGDIAYTTFYATRRFTARGAEAPRLVRGMAMRRPRCSLRAGRAPTRLAAF